MKRRSLRFRLTASYTAFLALTFACAGFGVWWILRDSVLDTVDRDLHSRVRSFRDYVQQFASDLNSTALSEEMAEMTATAPAGTRYRIANVAGRLLYQSPGTASWGLATAPTHTLSEEGQTTTVSEAGKRYRLLVAPVPGGIIEIAVPFDEFEEVLEQFTWTAALLCPVLLVIAAAGGYWMSGRVLTPVQDITRIAQDISARNLAQRLPVDGPGDELDRLSATLNSMFARLEMAFLRMAQFMADASHELRTPVAIMRTTAELTLSKARSEPEYRKALERVLAESEHTTELLEDLMTLARSDLGQDNVHLLPTDVAAVARDAAGEVRVLADAHALKLETALPDHVTMLADPSLLRRLLVILLDNAIKYTPRGGRVRLSMRSDGSVAIEDTGIGISPEDLPHIFDRFYRVAKDRSRTTGGAGLGLSIARWIAARHGAEIAVESTPGSGSTFRVEFSPGVGRSSAKPVDVESRPSVADFSSAS